MTTNAAKDFDSIASDYAFFEAHATEAEADARAHLDALAAITSAPDPIRMLDFGCGSGAFTARFLEGAHWPRERLALTLVDPAVSVRQQAVTRLSTFTAAPIADMDTLPEGFGDKFELVLSNHALYYVTDLEAALLRLIEARASSGVLLASIAARTNALVEFWVAGFRLLGREVPYNTSEDVERILTAWGAKYRKRHIPYTLVFPDSAENRMRIIRFLLADHLASMPLKPLMTMFDRHARAGVIEIHTESVHFVLGAT